ncbi:MAG: hypothetical protein ABIS36_04895 [Chryseolinea sp.]
MKTTTLLFLAGLSVMLGACGTDDETTSPLWGIDFSSENSSGFAMGSVDQYKSDTKTIYIVKTANMRCAGEDTYALSYTFESGDELELMIAKKTPDSKYEFPGLSGENQLLSATFNGNTLNLVNSKIVIQPRTEENKFATTTNLQTMDEVVFDGAIGRVPLLK